MALTLHFIVARKLGFKTQKRVSIMRKISTKLECVTIQKQENKIMDTIVSNIDSTNRYFIVVFRDSCKLDRI